jgi:hypothetical protein
MIGRHPAAAMLLTTSLFASVAADATIPVRVTHRNLVARCFNGTPVPADTRKWDIRPGLVTLAFSMRSEPRRDQTVPEAGTATIAFTAQEGHRYEVEVRADAEAFSSRLWRTGEWIPVVRDRTTDRIVSDTPRWHQPPCTPIR